MAKLLTLLVSGAVSGAIFATMASGLVLTYTTSGTFNLAHGAVAFAVSFTYFQLHTGAGMPIVPAALISILVVAPVLGLALDRMLLRRLADAPVHARIVGTVGLLVALPNAILWATDQVNAHGGHLRTTQELGTANGLGPAPAHVFHPVGDLVVNTDQLAVLLASGMCAAALWFVLRRTRLGLRMRADVDRRHLAAIRGVDTARVSAAAWILSTVLAGLGGVLLSPFFGVDDGTYTLVVLGSIAAAVIARLRSVPVAFLGGLLLGIVQNLVAGYADQLLPPILSDLTGLRSAVPFAAVIIGLVILGRARGRSAGTRATEAPPPDHRDGMSAFRRRAPWTAFTVLGLGWALFLAPDFWAFLTAKGLVFATIFLSFVVVTGMGGMVSLAQGSFVTAGGFVAGWALDHQFAQTVPVLMTNGRLSYLPAILAAAVLAALVGVVVALPVRRLDALPMALATLAIAFVGDLLVFQVDSVRHGSLGYSLRPPVLGPFDAADAQTMVVFTAGVFALLCLGVRLLHRSAVGRAMLASRSSDAAARASGISPERTKLVVFAVSAAIAGIGGVLFGTVTGTMTNTSATPVAGLVWLAVVVTWGVRRPGGALLAGLLFGVGNELLLRVTTWNGTLHSLAGSSRFLPILFGLGAVQLAMDPDGLLSLSARQRAELLGRFRRPEGSVADGVVATPGVDAALAIRELRAGYEGVEVLHGVDLDLGPGRVLAILGPNGAGKTTLCGAIAGLVPVAAGGVFHRGVNRTHERADERARAGIFLVPEGRGIFPGLSVDDNLRLWLPEAADRGLAYERFPVLHVRRDHAAGLLSGGEQQMLSLVGALVRPPDVLVADEPTLGLAPLVAERVCATLADLRDRGVTILLVEEKAETARRLADDIAVLSLGRVVWSGPRESLDESVLTTAYLGATAAASASG